MTWSTFWGARPPTAPAVRGRISVPTVTSSVLTVVGGTGALDDDADATYVRWDQSTPAAGYDFHSLRADLVPVTPVPADALVPGVLVGVRARFTVFGGPAPAGSPFGFGMAMYHASTDGLIRLLAAGQADFAASGTEFSEFLVIGGFDVTGLLTEFNAGNLYVDMRPNFPTVGPASPWSFDVVEVWPASTWVPSGAPPEPTSRTPLRARQRTSGVTSTIPLRARNRVSLRGRQNSEL